jgi:hypothetical protein
MLRALEAASLVRPGLSCHHESLFTFIVTLKCSAFICFVGPIFFPRSFPPPTGYQVLITFQTKDKPTAGAKWFDLPKNESYARTEIFAFTE